MLNKIIEAEHNLNNLLPATRKPTAKFLAAQTAWANLVWAEAERLGPMPLTAEESVMADKLSINPVYICGVQRSGTTLLRDLLDSHPELCVLPSEGTYYTNLESKLLVLEQDRQMAFLVKEWLCKLAAPVNYAPYWLLGKSREQSSPYVDFARYVMACWAISNNKLVAVILAYAACTDSLNAGFWVDKTPANELFLSRIWHDTPQAKIIHVVREAPAVIASRRVIEPGVSTRSVLKDIKSSYKIAAEQVALNDPRYLLIRYEDICHDPETVTQRVREFLGIKDSPLLSCPTIAGILSQANSSFNHNAKPGKILKPQQAPKTEVLSICEKQLMATYVGNIATQFNYSFTKVGLMRGLYLKLRYLMF
ncbi:sulfotransferase [Mucilaginibacter sp. HMF5004]|uniref:sulfotransferase family protein n=1 Tax=Mucilaginibacter rivuli TaxID=2857527 RepID=UPI001C5FF4CC|nr:sulfotransferase [Mucilaginibacter rivuli]MBW4888682.1 sulfotransferase [Mucilaginibacter rivuli]